MKLIFVEDAHTISALDVDALRKLCNGDVEVISYKTEESVMHNRRNVLVSALSMLAGGLGAGAAALTDVAVANSNMLSSFSQRYGNNPRSLNGSHRRNSKAAAQKRAAKKLRNVRAKSSKRA